MDGSSEISSSSGLLGGLGSCASSQAVVPSVLPRQPSVDHLIGHVARGRRRRWAARRPGPRRHAARYALRGCSRALLAGSKARASFMFAGGCWWRSLAVDGSSGASRGHAPVVRRPGSRWGGAVERPSAFQAGHIPSWRGSCERYALPPVAADSRWLLLLLSPLLSADAPVPHCHGLLADDSVTPWSSPPSPGLFPATRPRPVLSQAPPPKPIAAGPYGSRVLSRGGVADHE